MNEERERERGGRGGGGLDLVLREEKPRNEKYR